MKKKITKFLLIITVLTAINTLILAGFCADKFIEFLSNRPIVISQKYDKGQDMIKAKASGKPIIAIFYTDWCRYCQKFVPVFDKVVNKKAIKEKFAVAYVNAESYANRYLLDEYEIPGYPAVYIIKGDKKQMLNPAELFSPGAKDYLTLRFLEELEEE